MCYNNNYIYVNTYSDGKLKHFILELFSNGLVYIYNFLCH